MQRPTIGLLTCCVFSAILAQSNAASKISLTIERYHSGRWYPETQSKVTLQHQSLIQLRCNVSLANPAIELRWVVTKVEGNPVYPGANVSTKFKNVGPKTNQVNIKYEEKQFIKVISVYCLAFNRSAKKEGNRTQQIHIEQMYPTNSVVIGDGKKVKVHAGQSVTLICKADGNPSPGYTWFQKTKKATTKLQESSNKLQIHFVPKNSKFEYRCQSGNTKLINSTWIKVSGCEFAKPSFLLVTSFVIWTLKYSSYC